MSDVRTHEEAVFSAAAGDAYLLRREDVVVPGLARVISLRPGMERLTTEPILNFESPIIEQGEPFDDTPGLLDQGMKLAVAGLRLVRAVPKAVRIELNQAIHEFGSEHFWWQMQDPPKVETSFGTVHTVRRLWDEETDPETADNILIIPPLGASTAGGEMARIANRFFEAGFVVWMVSSPGFEGKLPLGEASKLSVRRETRYVDQALDLGAKAHGVTRPAFKIFGPSQGGGIAIGLLYRSVNGGHPVDQVYSLAPCNGHGDYKAETFREYRDDFVIPEGKALKRHIFDHPLGALRRAKQLAPTLRLTPGAAMQMVGAAYGLTMREGHTDFVEQAASNPEVAAAFSRDRVRIISLEEDIVSATDEWPLEVTREEKGRHMDLLDDWYVEDGINFFRGKAA